MYEDDSKNVSIRGIVVKILLIILVICILMWIFPTKKDLENNLSNVNINNGSNVNIDPLLNTIFGQNIRTMQAAGRAYYYSATLPKNVGDSSNITLQELINKKMLIEFKDKNGNSCNTNASYVQLTKTGTNKYEMKTYLQCSGEENYIIDNLGCTDLCPNACTNTSNNSNNTSNNVKDDKEDNNEIGTGSSNNGNTKKFRYLYSCTESKTSWSGWSDWSTTYVSSNSNREVQTKTETRSEYGVTGTTTTYKEETSTAKYIDTIPAGAKNCTSVLKHSGTGFYREYTCTTTKKTPVTTNTYGYKNVTQTLYRYKTKTTFNNTYTKWSYSENDSSLKGCTIIKSELVTTK